MQKNLTDLRRWLRDCGYPDKVIDHGIYTASLQGPAPKKEVKVIPLISTYYSNYTNEHLCTVARQLISTSANERVKKAFQNVQFVQALKQPPNLLRTLSNSKFIRSEENQKVGAYKCSNSNCKICRLYLQDVSTITMSNGTIWDIRCRPTCSSLNIIYFLICSFCNQESYIGKTDDTRDRTNNHISDCRHGTGTGAFDKHVHKCGKLSEIPDIKERNKKEPFFKLFIMLECNNYHKLLDYERKFQNAGMDTMNRPH